jgi:transcriptional regulator with XRE-family HTH domain
MQRSKKQQIDERWNVSAEQFVDIRLKLRLSQEKLAKLMGVHRTTVARFENDGIMVPRLAALALGYLEDHYSPQVKTKVYPPTRLKEAYDEKQFVDGPTVVPLARKSRKEVEGGGTTPET